MKKKLLATLCMMIAVVSLVACGKAADPEPVIEDHVYEEVPDNLTPDKETSYTPENSDFIYTDETKTEIIGITEQGLGGMDLVFPEYVTKISNIYIISDTLKTVYFMNDDVILDNVSFGGSTVETITNLPSSLNTIPSDMFNGCSKLRTIGDEDGVIKLPANITEIGESAFSGCTRLTSIDLSNITNIKSYAFENCTNLSEVVWSKNLTSIGDCTFNGCRFKELSLPSSVKTVGENAFARNSELAVVEISNKTTVANSAFEACPLLDEIKENEEAPDMVEVQLDGTTVEKTDDVDESTETTDDADTTAEEN